MLVETTFQSFSETVPDNFLELPRQIESGQYLTKPEQSKTPSRLNCALIGVGMKFVAAPYFFNHYRPLTHRKATGYNSKSA